MDIAEQMTDTDFVEIKGMIAAYLEKHPEQEYGPAHIILADYNLDIEWIDEIMSRDDLPEHLAVFLGKLRTTVLSIEESLGSSFSS